MKGLGASGDWYRVSPGVGGDDMIGWRAESKSKMSEHHTKEWALIRADNNVPPYTKGGRLRRGNYFNIDGNEAEHLAAFSALDLLD